MRTGARVALWAVQDAVETEGCQASATSKRDERTKSKHNHTASDCGGNKDRPCPKIKREKIYSPKPNQNQMRTHSEMHTHRIADWQEGSSLQAIIAPRGISGMIVSSSTTCVYSLYGRDARTS